VGSAAGALLVLVACGCRSGAPRGEFPPIRQGLACLARSYDGNSFQDEYLQYVYPGEDLSSSLPGTRLTYRILDAYFIVLMMHEAGIDPGPARPLFDRAAAVTAALVPAWRVKGIYNLRSHPAAGGIALDTYAILARLAHDSVMSGVVEAGLDGDGWLSPDFYTGPESFRRLADESWAARALLAAGPHPEVGIRVLERICREAQESLAGEKDPISKANLVIHALDAIGDVPPGAAEEEEAARRGVLVRFRSSLRKEGIGLLEESAVRRDTLTYANLSGSLVRDGALSRRALEPILRELLRRQEKDGCWDVSMDEPGASGRTFATARVVLALQEIRNSRPAGGSPPREGRTPDSETPDARR
jgi:hypothetical protein